MICKVDTNRKSYTQLHIQAAVIQVSHVRYKGTFGRECDHTTEDDVNVSAEPQVGLQHTHFIYVYVYCIYELNYNTNYAHSLIIWLFMLEIFHKVPKTEAEDDSLKWWRLHEGNFPVLSMIARRYWFISNASCASGNICSSLHARLTSHHVNMFVFLDKSLHQVKKLDNWTGKALALC